ncbi:hypothetical protein T492DRAFT_456794 [Pavlovales sp. CCMP2436]|nr:hypothetical protein T492DRAFT_456794 [Pavlovales sp. CCMP2436]
MDQIRRRSVRPAGAIVRSTFFEYPRHRERGGRAMAVTLPMAATAATSALCSVAIVASYCVFPTLRLDPATQLMWWSLVDGLAALIFFAQYVQPADECAGYAFATQLLMLTSQAFFATFAIDLVSY